MHGLDRQQNTQHRVGLRGHIPRKAVAIRPSNLMALLLLLLLGSVSCANEPNVLHWADGGDWQGQGWKNDSGQIADGDPVRLALTQVRNDLPTSDYWSMLSSGSVSEQVMDDDISLSSNLRRGLLISLKRNNKMLNNDHVRVWRYQLGADISPRKISDGLTKSLIGFRLKAGSVVEFARAFGSAHAAQNAQSPTLMKLPHDTDSALALETGTVVSIPVQAQASVDVSGRFLTRAAHRSHEMMPFLRTSALGSTSGARQGTLLIDGRFMFQVIRLEQQKVRLRVVTGSSINASAGMSFSGMAMATYRFFPSSIIDRARSIRTRIDKARRNVARLRSVHERIKILRKDLPLSVDAILDEVGLPAEDPQGKKVRDIAMSTTDWAFDLADSAASVTHLDDQVLERADNVLKHIFDAYQHRLAPVLSSIQRLSSRSYNLNASLQLSGDFERSVRTVADYEFNLADPSAQRAFERAISGRAVWIDAFTGFVGDIKERTRLADLTLADDLASEDVSSNNPRVKRHATAVGDQRTHHFGISVSGLWMSTGMNWNSAINSVHVIDSMGQQSSYEARAWQFQKKVSWIGDNKSKSFASGAFIQYGQSDLEGGGYWFSWNKGFPRSTWKPVAESVGEFLNLLGPVAAQAGIPALYDGEHDGQVNAALDVVFSGQAMNTLFSAGHTHDAFLWKVLGDVAASFDNKFGLPMMMSPSRPSVLDSIEGGHEACEKVAKTFGAGYCFYFADTFIPALRAAQQSPDPAARLQFLEKFYKAGWFGNPAGSRLLVRYIASLIHQHGMSDQISIRASIKNSDDDSEAASPALEFGDPGAIALIESMTPGGLR